MTMPDDNALLQAAARVKRAEAEYLEAQRALNVLVAQAQVIAGARLARGECPGCGLTMRGTN